MKKRAREKDSAWPLLLLVYRLSDALESVQISHVGFPQNDERCKTAEGVPAMSLVAYDSRDGGGG